MEPNSAQLNALYGLAYDLTEIKKHLVQNVSRTFINIEELAKGDRLGFADGAFAVDDFGDCITENHKVCLENHLVTLRIQYSPKPETSPSFEVLE